MISLRHPLWLTALALGACGGKVVVDQGGALGGGGSATSSTGGGMGGAGGCKGLMASLQAKLAAAQACNPALDALQCSGAVVASDGCGCAVAANDQNAAAAQSANAAFQAFVDAGCGPYECFACPPPPPSPWYCDPTTAQCKPAFEK